MRPQNNFSAHEFLWLHIGKLALFIIYLSHREISDAYRHWRQAHEMPRHAAASRSSSFLATSFSIYSTRLAAVTTHASIWWHVPSATRRHSPPKPLPPPHYWHLRYEIYNEALAITIFAEGHGIFHWYWLLWYATNITTIQRCLALPFKCSIIARCAATWRAATAASPLHGIFTYMQPRLARAAFDGEMPLSKIRLPWESDT